MKLKSGRPAEIKKWLTYDMQLEDFKYFQTFFCTHFSMDLFELEKLEIIRTYFHKC